MKTESELIDMIEEILKSHHLNGSVNFREMAIAIVASTTIKERVH